MATAPNTTTSLGREVDPMVFSREISRTTIPPVPVPETAQRPEAVDALLPTLGRAVIELDRTAEASQNQIIQGREDGLEARSYAASAHHSGLTAVRESVKPPEDSPETPASGNVVHSLEATFRTEADLSPDPNLSPAGQRFERAILYFLHQPGFAVRQLQAGGFVRRELEIAKRNDWSNLRAAMVKRGIWEINRPSEQSGSADGISLCVHGLVGAFSKPYVTVRVLKTLRSKLEEANELEPWLAAIEKALESEGKKGFSEYLLKGPRHPERAADAAGNRTSRRDARESGRRSAGDRQSSWITRISQHELLTREEEIALARRIERGDFAAKQKLVDHNLKLVISIAKGYNRGPDNGVNLTFFDLIDLGVIGLVRAAEKFDFRRGFKFSTYATPWIRQSIQRGLENTNRTVRLPVHVERNSKKLDKVSSELMRQNGGHEPSIPELAQVSGLKEEEILSIQAVKFIASLDEPVKGYDETVLGERIAIEQPSPLEQILTRERDGALYKALGELPEPEREAVVLEFGLGGSETTDGRRVSAKQGRRDIKQRRMLAQAGVLHLRELLGDDFGEQFDEVVGL